MDDIKKGKQGGTRFPFPQTKAQCMWIGHLYSQALLLSCGLQGATLKNRTTAPRLGPQGAMNVHAALNQWVRKCCTEAGVLMFNLTEDAGYQALYRTYTKGRNDKRREQAEKWDDKYAGQDGACCRTKMVGALDYRCSPSDAATLRDEPRGHELINPAGQKTHNKIRQQEI